MIVAVLTCALLGMADRSEADCYCSAGPACTDAWKAAAIFIGRVQRITPHTAPKNEWSRSNQLVRLEVLETFRGFDTGTPAAIDILTSDDHRLCGFPFTVGNTYLVYATGPTGRTGPSDPYMRTSTCTRTRPLARADEDLAYLRSMSTTSAPTGRVFGRVEFADPRHHLAQDGPLPERPRPMHGIPVVLTRGDRTWRASTNEKGEYQVQGLSAGTYHVDVELPDTQYRAFFPGLKDHVQLPDARACEALLVHVSHDGRVRGRVVDGQGRPIAAVTVELIGSARLHDQYIHEERAMTAEDGTFEIVHVPPGRYALGIPAPSSETTRSWSRVWYPGVAGSGEARTFEVGPGARVQLQDLKVPSPYRFVTISGVVHAADGRPLDGARVTATDLSHDVGGPVSTTGGGRFRLALIEGQRYRLSTKRLAGDTPLEYSIAPEAVATRGSAPVLLTLEPVRRAQNR